MFSFSLKKCSNIELIFKRFKYKKKWAKNTKVQSNTELALKHYDHYLGSTIPDLWPSLRLGLLSQPKHVAVINNHTDGKEGYMVELAEKGAFDFVQRFKPIKEHTGKYSLIKRRRELEENSELKTNNDNFEEIKEEFSHKAPLTSSRSDLFHFVPAEKILSGREKFEQVEKELSTVDESTRLPLATPEEMRIPHLLKSFLYHKGDISTFEPAKRDRNSGKLSYYLLDGGSILPVLGLDLEPGCRVLDLCSAPGGKTITMMQTMLPDQVVCLDRSYMRMLRLKDTLRMYLTKNYVEEEKVKVILGNAVTFGDQNPKQFDRVIADVPCYADRHSLTSEDHTLFKVSNQGQRMLIQQNQQQLLLSAIKSCKVGGLIIYSTCTLHPSQNDSIVTWVIQKSLDLGMEVSVVDTGYLAEAYEDYFNFNLSPPLSSLGQLVLPHVTSNFGPTYFSKLKRLS